MEFVDNRKFESPITQEMIDWYYKRTFNHINGVVEFMTLLLDEYPELSHRSTCHDITKFQNIEIEPYIWITWKYYCERNNMDFYAFDPPMDLEEKMHNATIHHVTTNSHHPEFHHTGDTPITDLINSGDRDSPPNLLIQAQSMPDIDIVEMVCDWCSVAKERGTDPKNWADANINTRWRFSKDAEALIYKLIEQIWE